MSAVTRYACALLLLVSMSAPGPTLAEGSGDNVTWIADSHGCRVANTFPRPGESITWSGKCKDGFADGDGVLQWFFKGREDDRFEGNLAMGWAEGRGALAKADGGRYVGEWKHSVQEGTGRYDAPDGSWYQGEWKNGKPNGQGQYRRGDGKLFIGEWADGVFQSGSSEDQDQDGDEAPDPNRT
jgi:hypothetical protein